MLVAHGVYVNTWDFEHTLTYCCHLHSMLTPLSSESRRVCTFICSFGSSLSIDEDIANSNDTWAFGISSKVTGCQEFTASCLQKAVLPSFIDGPGSTLTTTMKSSCHKRWAGKMFNTITTSTNMLIWICLWCFKDSFYFSRTSLELNISSFFKVIFIVLLNDL